MLRLLTGVAVVGRFNRVTKTLVLRNAKLKMAVTY